MASRVVRRPSKDMQKFLKAGTTGRLLGPLERFLDSEPPEFRRQDILHPSAMAKTDWCPRAGYFQLQYADQGYTTPDSEKISLIKRNIFDEGHYIHDKWQQRFRRMGVLHGKWHCLECGSVSPEFLTSPSGCGTCGSPGLEYREVPLEYKPFRIGGHADGWIRDGKPDCLIEIKSVGLGSYRFEAANLVERYGDDANELWKNTKRPFTSHVNQGQIYLHLANLLFGKEAPQEIVFIYEFKVNQQIKEFVCPYSPDLVADKFAAAEDIVTRLRDNDPAPDCFTGHTCSQCKPYDTARL